MTRLVVILLAGVACYFAADAGATQVAIGFAVLGVIVLASLVRTERDLVLNVLRAALMTGVAFTGVACAISIYRGHVGGTALYGLLCALCVLGLLVKTADERSA